MREIAPKILLLSYDPNEEIEKTMKQLWHSLVNDESDEQEFIQERWKEIIKLAIEGLNCDSEWRKREAACSALTDLMPQRSWIQLQVNFRDIFLTALSLLDDRKDSVKVTAY